MNKVVHIPAFFAPVGKNVKVKVPTGAKKKSFLGVEKDVTHEETQFVQTGWSDREMDSQRLANDLTQTVQELNREGYEVVSVTPITLSRYSHTTSLIIVATNA